MARNVVLHIGTGKTGSTALQEFFFANTEQLAKQGYCYPRTGIIGGGHHMLGHLWGVGYLAEERREELVADELWAALQAEMDACDDNVLLSTEAWTLSFSRVPQSMCDVKAVFGDTPVTVIVYLRRQDKHAESRYNQSVKGGYPLGQVNDLDRLPEFYDYYGLLTAIAGVFGKDNVVVRPYEKGQFVNGTLFADFLHGIGLQWTDSFLVPGFDPNPRLSKQALELLIEANKIQRPIRDKRAFNRYVLDLFPAREEGDVAQILSPSVCSDILATYAEGNERVAREFLGRDDGVLFYEPIGAAGAGSCGREPLEVETALRLALRIWESMAP